MKNNLKIFYNPLQSNLQTNTPSSQKASYLIEQIKNGIFNKNVDVIENFELTNNESLSLAHDPLYIHNIMNLKKLTAYHQSSNEINTLLKYNVSSFVDACIYAVKNNTTTFSPTSGFHHAGYASPMGFCTFNGLLIACQKLRLDFGIKKIVIIDFDVHYGNGTDDIINKLNLNYIEHISFAKEINKYGVQYFMNNLENIIFSRVDNADLILYQAGADPHIDDDLGGLLTDDELFKRDLIVFELARDLEIPLVWNLAGGYQADIQKVLNIHLKTLEAYFRIYANLHS